MLPSLTQFTMCLRIHVPTNSCAFEFMTFCLQIQVPTSSGPTNTWTYEFRADEFRDIQNQILKIFDSFLIS